MHSRQTIHTKCQALFSQKKKKKVDKKYFRMSSAAIVIGALKVKYFMSSLICVCPLFWGSSANILWIWIIMSLVTIKKFENKSYYKRLASVLF